MEMIKIKGARVNNLKSVDLEIPINKITCLAGPSGSGKSSIAFHTLYAESKRRFLNSFPTYLKFFTDRPAPVDVDSIEPVLPVFGLPQINPIMGTRSCIADTMQVTEIFQNLYFHHGVEYCPIHNIPLEEVKIAEQILNLNKKILPEDTFYILTDKESFLEKLKDTPFPSRSMESIDSKHVESFNKEHDFWELLRFKWKSIDKAQDQLNSYLNLNIPVYVLCIEKIKLTQIFSNKEKKCPLCTQKSIGRYTIAQFTPYNALGACPNCKGFGANLVYDEEKIFDKSKSVNDGGIKILEYQRFGDLIKDCKKELKKNKFDLTLELKKQKKDFFNVLYNGLGAWCGLNEIFEYLESKKYKPSVRIFLRGIQKEEICDQCNGTRISKTVQNFKIFEEDINNYGNIWNYDISQLHAYIKERKSKSHLYKVTDSGNKLLDKLLKILNTAEGIGLGHLSLTRKVKSVSSGEYQRLLLLKHLAYEGTGALFIFDEPSLGLSGDECKVLLKSFKKLIEKGNTVLLVEHSKMFHENCDKFVQMGPLAGSYGGEVVFQGDYNKFNIQKNALDLKIKKKSDLKRKWLTLSGSTVYSKKFPDIKIPINEIIHVTGRSGGGKSAVFVNTLANIISTKSEGVQIASPVGVYQNYVCEKKFDSVIVIDSNLNRYSSRSTVGSLTGLFTVLRKHFSSLPVSKSMGLKDGHFSANSELGQCPACQGSGHLVVEMQFLEDVILTCEDCKGKKIKPLYSEISDGKMTVFEAYNSPLSSIIENIKLTPKFRRIWEYMKILKLDYLSLDRAVASLSGGERQRLYLLSKLEKEIENSFIIFENISFGLSHLELESLTQLLLQLNDKGNSIVLIDQDEFFSKVSTFEVRF